MMKILYVTELKKIEIFKFIFGDKLYTGCPMGFKRRIRNSLISVALPKKQSFCHKLSFSNPYIFAIRCSGPLIFQTIQYIRWQRYGKEN